MTIDGKIARENGDVEDWIFTEEHTKNEDLGYSQYYSTISCIITGRKTWDVSKKLEENPFPGKAKYVFTRNQSLINDDDQQKNKAGEEEEEEEEEEEQQNCQVVRYVNEDPASFVRKLKEDKPGEKIWLLGGGEIIQELHDAKLIDEMIITIQPTILGKGIPLWNNLQIQSEWQLINLEKWSCGLVQLIYSPKPPL
jgi:dihydrofolate reductase